MGAGAKEKVEGVILGRAVIEDSLGLCLMCFEVTDCYQKIVTVKS